MANMDELREMGLTALLQKAWLTRQENHPDQLTAFSPGAKTYITDHHQNRKNKFVNVSITGSDCALNCDHCQKTLLNSMRAVESPEELVTLGEELVGKGCEGILISGGADQNGEVPLQPYFGALASLKEMGLKVLVHSGLATTETASQLKKAGIDQVLIDIIGDQSTISEIYAYIYVSR